jgi:hypothetical protein
MAQWSPMNPEAKPVGKPKEPPLRFSRPPTVFLWDGPELAQFAKATGVNWPLGWPTLTMNKNKKTHHNAMKKPLISFLAVLSLLLGCESTPHYNRTKVVSLGAPMPKKAYGTVKLFQSKGEVKGGYDVIALMSVEGKAGEEAEFIKAFLYRAADLGADAIIFYRVNVAVGRGGGGWFAGRGGGFGMPGDVFLEESYRAEAIHFK